MPFKLENVVPWGRNLDEYTNMFNLSKADLKKNILSVGDGPASFNYQMTRLGNRVTSLDPIYTFTKQELESRIDEVKGIVMKQVKDNVGSFVWKTIKSVDELEKVRLNAMSEFIDDYEEGIKEQRYIYHEMPQKTEFNDNEFELGLSSHFLLLYSDLGVDFHIAAITEMLRVCKEVRVFPIINLSTEKSEVLKEVITYFEKEYSLEIVRTNYEFQKGGNEMLRIK